MFITIQLLTVKRTGSRRIDPEVGDSTLLRNAIYRSTYREMPDYLNIHTGRSFLRTTGIPFGFLWCYDTLKLLSCLQCCRSVTDRGELMCTLCTGVVVVPAVTLFRTIYKPLRSRSHCCHYLSTYFLCHPGSIKNVCNV